MRVADCALRNVGELLEPARHQSNLTVRGDAHVRRLVVERGRVVAVELTDGERLPAGAVVLDAGVVQAPLLLWRSGIGPADAIRGLGG